MNKIEKIAHIISKYSKYEVTFGDIDLGFDGAPTSKGYGNITIEEYRQAHKLLQCRSFTRRV